MTLAAKTYDKGEDRTQSTFDHLLKGCFLAAIIPVLFVWVFGRPGCVMLCSLLTEGVESAALAFWKVLVEATL